MSIWTDCKEHHAVPFFGYPVLPRLDGDVFSMVFPEGYTPNGNQMQQLSEKIRRIMGAQIVSVTDTELRIRLASEKVAYVLYEYLVSAHEA